MKTIRKHHELLLFKRAVSLISLISLFATSALSLGKTDPEQNVSDTIKNEWWFPILQKHHIELKNYFVYHGMFVIGDQKKLNDSIEAYQNAIVLGTGGIYFAIYEKCDTVYYNSKSKIFRLKNGSETLYKKDFSLVNPFQIYDVGLYEDDFVHNTALSSVSTPKSEIKKETNDLFDQYIQAIERMDYDFIENTINDKYQAGFIYNGKYYASSNSFLFVYRSETKGIKDQQIKVSDKKIIILADHTVLLTADGDFIRITQSGITEKGTFAWSFICEKIENKWKVIYLNLINQKI